MSNAPPAKKRARVPVQVQFDPETLRLARLHRIENGENVSDLVNRLVWKHFGGIPSDGPRPAA